MKSSEWFSRYGRTMTDPSLTRRGRNQHSLTFQIPSASKDVYKYMYSFFPQTIRDWNDLPESLSDDSVSKFTSLVGLIFLGQSHCLTGGRRQTKQFCFLDADCLVVGESQSSSRRSAGRYPVKPPRPEGDSQTIDTLQCTGTSPVLHYTIPPSPLH